MEIKRVGENKIKCVLTENEIQEMGFSIDDIIKNGESTQKFMRVVLDVVEEQEHINVDEISPMIKAELLQDHTMAITFGDNNEGIMKDLMGTVSQLMSQLKARKEEEKPKKVPGETLFCALRFSDMQTLIQMSKVCFPGKMPKSSLYKMDGFYYILLDFTGFEKEEMRVFAFGAVEYDDAHYSEPAQIAYIQEHGKNIIKSDALQMLMQL